MKWTREQQQIIETRGKNILVSAAAGSGKTAVLVERIKNLIIKDHIPLKSMLVVTFTNAAAGEMKQRIIDSINNELEQEDDEFLRDQIQNIYSTHISTFHSFAISILKRYYHVIGIDPSFKICGEDRLEVFRNEALDQLFSEKFEKEESSFIDFMNAYSSSKNEDAVRTMILDTCKFLETIPESDEWLINSVEALNSNIHEFKNSETFEILRYQISNSLRSAMIKNHSLISLLKDCDVASLTEISESDQENMEMLAQALEDDSFEVFLKNLEEFSFKRFAAKKDDKEAYAEIKDKVNSKRKSIKADVEYVKNLFPDCKLISCVDEMNETYAYAKVLKDLVTRFTEIFREIKEHEKIMDFGDVERLAIKILTHEEVATEYRKKFEYIFIDEYQDSNYIQETLIGRIKREDNLFMVGDVKQSIYKFRRAEPAIFISRYEEYGSGSDDDNSKCIRINLNSNFRSKKNIINCINNTFVHIMEKNLSGMDYDENAQLFQGLEYEKKWDIPTDLYVVDSGSLTTPAPERETAVTDLIQDTGIDSEINDIATAELEAIKIAGIIKRDLGKPIFDIKLGIERPLEYKDIVILMRTVKNQASIIYETLMDQGIPTFSDGGDDYLSTIEIETFVNLLKVIDNRRQDVPLVSVMYSPVFGFTTEDLIKIRLTDKTGDFYSAFLNYISDGPDENLCRKCEEANDRINKWKRDESFMELDGFLWKLMNESGYYNYAGALLGGIQRRANLRALIDRASEYSENRISGLFGFIRYLEQINKNDIKMGQIKLLSENDNVVRISSIHKSKGLEFPYVILAGLGKKFNKNSSRSKVALQKDLGLALQWENYELHSYKKTLLSKMIRESTEIDELAEEIRILYVAMSRAMDKLVLIGTINPRNREIGDVLADYEDMDPNKDIDIRSASSYLELILPLAKSIGVKPECTGRGDIVEALISDTGNERSRKDIKTRIENLKKDFIKDESNMQLTEEIQRRLDYIYPYTKTMNLKSKYSVTGIPDDLTDRERKPEKIMTFGMGDDRISELTPDFLKDESPMSAARRGTVLHTVLEKINFKEAIGKKGDPDYIGDVLDGLVKKEILTEEERNSVRQNEINYFLSSDIMKRAAGSDNIHKERPFNLRKRFNGENIIIQGIIDCYFEEEGQIVLLDYKSNYIDRNDPDAISDIADRYKDQIDLYREALVSITGKEVKEAFLYLTRIGRTISMI